VHWANKQKLVLGQVKTDEKSNEIQAVPLQEKKAVVALKSGNIF